MEPILPLSENPASPKGMIADLLESIVIAAVICAFIYIFVVTPNIVHGPSMLPTFKESQLVLTTSRIAHWLSDTGLGEGLGLGYHRGDVIVFHTPSGEDLIKRVIGLPGETINLEKGRVVINGNQITEKYLDSAVQTNGGTYLAEGEEIIIPSGHYFVMGDNRPESRDSRDSRVGLVDKNAILGKVILRYWPLQDFTVLQPGEITI
jgi:signal peptidase I